MVDLTDGTYRLTELFGQWYKFAFVCVPSVGGATGTAMLQAPTPTAPDTYNHDYADWYVDYTAALTYQANNLNTAQGQDMAIYRAAIDRWIDLGVEGGSVEDVTLTRQTGELVLDMGIPEDQFDTQYGSEGSKRPVDHYIITLKTPTQMAVGDKARDELAVSMHSDELKFKWKVSDQKVRQEIHISLLPDAADSGSEPRLAYLSVQAFDANDEPFSWTNAAGDNVSKAVLQDENTDRGIQVKKNIRTTVLFNGLNEGEFEVRYAGFNDDATIDVDDDAWDGND